MKSCSKHLINAILRAMLAIIVILSFGIAHLMAEDISDVQVKLENVAISYLQGIANAGDNPLKVKKAESGGTEKIKAVNEKFTFTEIKLKTIKIYAKTPCYVKFVSPVNEKILYTLYINSPDYSKLSYISDPNEKDRVFNDKKKKYNEIISGFENVNKGDVVTISAYIDSLNLRMMSNDIAEFGGEITGIKVK